MAYKHVSADQRELHYAVAKPAVFSRRTDFRGVSSRKRRYPCHRLAYISFCAIQVLFYLRYEGARARSSIYPNHNRPTIVGRRIFPKELATDVMQYQTSCHSSFAFPGGGLVTCPKLVVRARLQSPRSQVGLSYSLWIHPSFTSVLAFVPCALLV